MITLMMDDGPIAIVFIVVFFALVLLLAKLSKFKPKYRNRIDIAREERIKKLKQELKDL